MPNIKSAIKRVKIEEKRKARNSSVKSAYKTAVKKCELAINENDEKVQDLLNNAKKMIDQAETKGVISKNAASRKKSKLEVKANNSKKSEDKKGSK